MNLNRLANGFKESTSEATLGRDGLKPWRLRPREKDKVRQDKTRTR
jgi:hypothetical protein